MSHHYNFRYCYGFVLIGTMDIDWQHIHHMAKWVCIFCFEMKGAAIFDWTVLRCDHLVCIKCFKKNVDFLKTSAIVTVGQLFWRAQRSISSRILTVEKWQLERYHNLFSLPFETFSFFRIVLK